MRSVLISAVLLYFLAAGVNCQEEGDSSFWDSLKKIVKDAVAQLKEMWNNFMTEVRARTRDIGSWTEEAWTNFKQSYLQWMENTNMNEVDKQRMKDQIERMEMPESKQ